MSFRRFALALSLLALPTLLSACADVPKSPEAKAEFEATNDPLEPMNRTIFDVNDFLDRLLIRPVTELYRFVTPQYARDRLANVLSNMGEPINFMNDTLQGRFADAGTTVERFGVNTTVGVAGIWEVADGWGLKKKDGDFGQTLHTWGLGSGPYLVLPLFGPSNFRDAAGLGVDMVASPWQYIALYGGQGTENRFNGISFLADGLTRRDQSLDDLDALRAGSIDFYAEMRSVYRQYRNKQLGVKDDTIPVFEDYN